MPVLAQQEIRYAVPKQPKGREYNEQPSKGNNGPVNQTLGQASSSEQLSICACNPQNKNTCIHVLVVNI